MAAVKNQPIQNKFLQPLNSPVDTATNPQQVHVPWQFGIKQRIQAKNVRLSKLTIKEVIQLSGNSVGTASFLNGGVLFLSSILTINPPHGNDINFAIPYPAIYQGTYPGNFDSNYQIYPSIGGSITPFSYAVQGDTDWNLYNGTTSAWGGAIKNNTGTTQLLSFVTQWKFLYYSEQAVS